MNNLPKRVAFHNLGCKVNAYETDAMIQAFTGRGFEAVTLEEPADIYIINTCSVTNIADRKSRQMLHKAKKQNPDGFVVAVGCYVQVAFEEVQKDESVDLCVGNNKKAQIVDIVLEAYEKKLRSGQESMPCDVVDIGTETTFDAQFLTKITSHTRAFIKVQDGCNQFCSYCIIPYTRGRIRSRLPQDVVSEVRELVKNGICEIVLTGIHLSSYGMDYQKQELTDEVQVGNQKKSLSKLTLLDLITIVSEIPGVLRVRLGSLEPRIVTKAFAGALAENKKVCPHFHLSLQSGCDATLLRMNRKYNTKEYKEACDILRAAYQNPAITTDVIVGFPGETEEEFDITTNYLRMLGLYEMHIFKYSVRKGTRAQTMPCHVPEPVKATRSEVLLDMTRAHSRQYRESFLDEETLSVLFEEAVTIDKKEYLVGYTERYVKVALLSPADANAYLQHVCEVKPVSMLNEELILCREV